MTGLVIDASAVTEFVLASRLGGRVTDRLDDVPPDSVHIPHLCLSEVSQALRSLARGGVISPDRGAAAIALLHDFGAVRHGADPFLARVWELRHNLTAYDALYVALAEALDARLMTCDRGMARAAQPLARVVLIEA
ncbi:MAG: type II toxin-antitoxin system VapC family toxin [Actinomycetota bacterium]|nr:type II toxin-antitoxin system VapC family toxin [Actinomycetota bacterium]